jgi:hypothetical protein
VDFVSTCVLCIWNAFIDSLPNPLRSWGKKRFTHYSVKKYRVHTLKWPRYFRQSRPSNYWFLGSKFTEKTQIKSMADHVRFNPFYWAFETLAPRLRDAEIVYWPVACATATTDIPWHMPFRNGNCRSGGTVTAIQVERHMPFRNGNCRSVGTAYAVQER